MKLSVIPWPLRCEIDGGEFVLDPSTCVVGSDEFVKQVRQAFLKPTGLPLRSVDKSTAKVIRGSINPELSDSVKGSYQLRVTTDTIDITAGEPSGLFYGIQTLRQLLPVEIFKNELLPGVRWAVPCVQIEDAPLFAWRGIMLDCSRHFFDADFIKAFIDNLALHKFNILHWHLTDDQGWRIEIKKYPKLTEIGAWRAETVVGHANDRPVKYDGIRYGGFYSQLQIRDIVKYAAERHVTIVPEIEMPGHSRAAIAAYPELGNNSEPISVGTTWGVEKHILNADESTIQFYQDVLAEVLDLFPSQFIHVGGDEAIKDEWKATPRIQQRIHELGLRDEADLQAYFIKRMDEFLTARGRRLIGWDEILEGELAPGATVMSWRGDAGAIRAATLGHDAVMASRKHAYLDYYQSQDKAAEPLAIHGYLPLEQAYAMQVVPDGLTASRANHVLGGQAQLWTEYMPTAERLHYMMYPRAIAIAEAFWTAPARRSYSDFLTRLPYHVKLMDSRGVHGRPVSSDGAS